MNDIEAPIEQIRYTFSNCRLVSVFFFLYTTQNLMKRLFYFYNACYNYRWKLKCSPKVRILRRRNSLVRKSHLKQVDQIVRLIFSYGNSGFSI